MFSGGQQDFFCGVDADGGDEIGLQKLLDDIEACVLLAHADTYPAIEKAAGQVGVELLHHHFAGALSTS